jgi:hypothetical protein
MSPGAPWRVATTPPHRAVTSTVALSDWTSHSGSNSATAVPSWGDGGWEERGSRGA